MAKQYFTLTGCNHYFGNCFIKKGMKVKLKKEPKNEYDAEAIMVKMKEIGKVGYVANSAYTDTIIGNMDFSCSLVARSQPR